jgi:hypothetical protein
MGIKGFHVYIKTKIPFVRTGITNTTKEQWGIDCSCLLFRAKGAGLSSLTAIAQMIVRVRTLGVEPIVVFDGQPPKAKAATIEKRRAVRKAVHNEMAALCQASPQSESITDRIEMEAKHEKLQRKAPTVSSNDRDEVKSLLHAAGVRFITASGEADDVLAYLSKTNVIQAVVSSDLDMLAHGVPKIIIPETDDGTVLTEIRLSSVLDATRLTFPQFVYACQLMGTDYTKSQCNPVEAIRRAQQSQLSQSHPHHQSWDDLVSPGQRTKWSSWVPKPEHDTLTDLCQRMKWPPSWKNKLDVSSTPV